MNTLHDIRSTIRALMAAEEAGHMTPDQRRTILTNVVKDLQDVEINLDLTVKAVKSGYFDKKT